MDFLSHYTKLKTSKLIIEKQSLKFGLVKKSNDPVEIKKLYMYASGLDVETIKIINKDLNDYKNKILRIACFCEGYSVKLTGDDSLIFNLMDERPSFYLPRMWAQYGENHKGVCFIFDKAKLIKKITKELNNHYFIKHGKINYKDFIKTNHLADTEALIDINKKIVEKLKINKSVQHVISNNYNEMFFTKDIDWKDENEYRFLIWNKLTNTNYDDIFIDIQNCIKGVILGLKFPKSELQKFKTYCISNNIFLYKLVIKDFAIIANPIY